MEKNYKILQSGTRQDLEKQINIQIADAPHEWEFGNLVIIDTDEYTTFYQFLVRTTHDQEALGGAA